MCSFLMQYMAVGYSLFHYLFLILAVTWGIQALPDMYALCSWACGPRADISDKAFMPVLQLQAPTSTQKFLTRVGTIVHQ